jgi:hypothetical protein
MLLSHRLDWDETCRIRKRTDSAHGANIDVISDLRLIALEYVDVKVHWLKSGTHSQTHDRSPDANTLVALPHFSLGRKHRHPSQQASTTSPALLLVRTLDANHPAECIPASLQPCLETPTRLQQRYYVAKSRRFSEQSGWLETIWPTTSANESHCCQCPKTRRTE